MNERTNGLMKRSINERLQVVRRLWKTFQDMMAQWGVTFEDIMIEAGYNGIPCRYLTIPEACWYMGGISERTLYSYFDDGLLYRKPGGRTLIKIDDIDDWMDRKIVFNRTGSRRKKVA